MGCLANIKDMDANINSWIHLFLNELRDVGCKSPHTLKSYKLDLEQVFSTEEKLLNNENTSEDELLRWVGKAQSRWASLSLASRNRKAGTLKSFFNWLYRSGFIEVPLAEKIISPKVPKKIPNFISVDEAIYLIKLLNQSVHKNLETEFEQQRVLILLLYGGGLRISEACGLRWENIDLKKRQIMVKGKGDKERLLILPEISIEAIRVLKSTLEYIWGEKPLPQRLAFNWVRKWGARANFLRPLNPHALRHSYATHLLQGGADLRVLQELLGHSSLVATEKYTHLTVDHLARVVNSLHPLKDEK
jgi:integrase/recombinase XerC/integrase/recombinase XerD